MQTHRIGKWALGLALSAACLTAMAQDLKRLSAVADQLAKDKHFSGTMLVAQGDRILLDRAYGDANIEWHIHNQPDTRFRLGSITKQFTAASVLLLKDRGKLQLTDTLGQHLPELPEAWHKVTIYQLLTHTSGIHSFTDIPQYRSNERFTKTPAEILDAVRTLPLDFEPGSQFNYSNSGYVVLGMLIEKLSGESYAQFVQKNIFDPLGMKDSGYDSNTAIIPKRAAGYSVQASGLQNAGFIDMSIPHAAGALYSTTGDLLRWQRALYQGKLLKPESLKAMTTPNLEHYALGLGVQDGPEGKKYGHGGGIEGFSTLIGYLPADGISVILLSNTETHLLPEIERPLFQITRGKTVLLPSERKEIAVTPAQQQEVAGTYVLPDGTRFWVRAEGKGLSTRLGAQPWVPIFAESKDHFYARLVDAQFDVVRGAGNAVESITLKQNGNQIHMPRIVEKDPEYATVPFFLRGDMNDWGTASRMQKLDGHTYAATLKLDKNHYAFKLGSEDFKQIDFGGMFGKESVALGAPQKLEAIGQNLQVDIPAAGAYQFALDTSDPRAPQLTITKAQ